MIHRTYEEDGNEITELDAEAIDYLIEGLVELREMEPGDELSTPSVNDDLSAMGSFILRRAADEE